MTQDQDKEIAHEVLRSIRQIVRRISEYSRQLSREVGLTVPQLMCLKAIGDLEDLEDLCRRLHLCRQKDPFDLPDPCLLEDLQHSIL